MAQNIHNNQNIPMAGQDQGPPPAYTPEVYQDMSKYPLDASPANQNSVPNAGFANSGFQNGNNYSSQPITVTRQPVIITTSHGVRQQVTIPGVRCSSCQNQVLPIVVSEPNACTFISCCCFAVFLTPLCCWIPFVTPCCQDQKSKCPNCGHTLARF